MRETKEKSERKRKEPKSRYNLKRYSTEAAWGILKGIHSDGFLPEKGAEPPDFVLVGHQGALYKNNVLNTLILIKNNLINYVGRLPNFSEDYF